jgi:cytochrome P450
VASTPPRPSLIEHLRLAVKVNDLAWTLDHLYAKFGPVADVGYRVPIRVVYLMGVEANRYILSEHPENFTWNEAFALLEVVDGPTALVLSDGDEHRRRRRLVQPAFAIKRVDVQLDLIVREIDRTLSTWTPGRRLDAMAELRATVRRIVVRALFGEQLGAEADHIGELLEPALRYVARTPMSRIDIELPFLPYSTAVRARRAVDAIVLAEVHRRRRWGVDANADPDTLSALLAAADEAGGTDALTDAEVCDQIRSLIAAGYDTTSSAAAWLVYGLATNPAALGRLRTQVRDTIGDRAPTTDDLRAMPLVDGVVRETLRLWSPAAFSGRRAVDNFELYGYRIPAGSMVIYSPYITHRLPEVWGDPLVYRPERWSAGEPVPFSFVPFGGGYRKCIGFALATLELQVLAVRLAQRVNWRPDRPDVRGAGIANFAPKGGLPITVTAT